MVQTIANQRLPIRRELLYFVFHLNQFHNRRLLHFVRHSHNYYFKSGLAAEIESIGTIKKYEQLMTNCLWKTFDEFRNCAFGIWRVTKELQFR